jgi:putative oxidoreductase
MSASFQSRLADFGLLMIRLILAAVFIYHGGQKLFGWFGGHGLQGFAGNLEGLHIPYPMVAAVLSGGTEFLGGVILLLGTGTRLAAVPMAFNMAVACATVHLAKGFAAQNGGMEYPLTLGVVLLALVLLGPGRITVGRIFSRR